MKIGIIGPLDSINNILKIKHEFVNDVSFNVYIAHTLKETREQIKVCQDESDGILFTGPAVFDCVINHIKLYKPHIFVPHNESSLYSFLLREKNLKMKNISIDVIEKNIAKESLKDTSIENFYILPHKTGDNEKTYISFHEKNIKENNVDTILTTFSPIYDYFKEKKFPVYRLYTTLFSIRNCINTLINEIKNKEIDFAKISIQIIKIDFEEKRVNKFSILEKSLEFQKKIIPYLQLIQGAIFHNNWNEFIIFSNKGFLMSNEAKIEFLKLLSKNNFSIISGIGVGKTASEAEINAYEALKFSTNQKKNCFFICDEDKNIIDPTSNIDFNIGISITDEQNKINDISQKIDLSIGYINKIKNIITLYKTNVFSSDIFANYLGISNKSARRILKKLMDGGYASIVGKELKYSAGRPQNMIKIDLDI